MPSLPPDNRPSHIWDRLPRPLHGWRAIAAGALCAALITLACAAVISGLPAHGVAMFYILTVVAAAVAFGMLAGIATATAAFFCYNYFFLQPTYTFTISDPRDLVALLIFFVSAIASGSLAGRLREVAEQARQRSRSLEVLNSLAQRLADAANVDAVAHALVDETSRSGGCPAILIDMDADGPKILAQTPDAPAVTTADWQAAQRSANTKETVYPAAAGWEGTRYELRPVIVRDRVTAVLGLRQSSFDDLNEATTSAMIKQASVAWERLRLEAERTAAEKRAESERLRSLLLSSVSHDLKTPLAVIQGAVTSLRDLGAGMPVESKSELLATIDEEAARLSRFVTNVLDMMRFEAGPAAINLDWVDLADTLGTTLAHARKIMPSARFELDVQVFPAIVRGDEILLEHVIFNVLENAAAATAAPAAIKMKLSKTSSGYRVAIEDDGQGIAADALPRIFDKFYRAPGRTTRGSGLGLTICKQVMTALGGSITAESPIANARGTRITLFLPDASEAISEGQRS